MLPASANTIRAWIVRSYDTERQMIQKSLGKSRSRIHFTMDMWTSPNHLALLGIVAHYMDQNGRLNKALVTILLLS